MPVIIVEVKLYQVAGGHIIVPFTIERFAKWRGNKITAHLSLFSYQVAVAVPLCKQAGHPFNFGTNA